MNLCEYTYDLVKQIPKGRVSTYGAVAKALGSKKYARAVGRYMNQNPNPDGMPCFKIVKSDGSLGGFGRGIEDKIRRLNKDGIEVKNGEIVDFEKKFFDDFKTDYPLLKLRNEQIKLRKKVDLKDSFTKIESVAGLDVSFKKDNPKKVCGACVVIDYKTKATIEEKTVQVKIDFPYIPTYLSYRELPVYEKLLEKLDTKPTVFMIDGNGILHPYFFGIASHAGVKFDISTIGVAKSHLCGNVQNNIIKVKGEKAGFLFYASEKLKNPVYVSPGHKISFETSERIVKKMSRYRIPEPIRRAHILAKTKR